MKLIARKSDCKNVERKMLVISPKQIIAKTISSIQPGSKEVNNTDTDNRNKPNQNSGFNCDEFQCFRY
jgi:hypothetical protein